MPKIWRAVKSWMSCASSNAVRSARVAGEMGHQAELDLAVIGGEQRVLVAARDEGAADSPPELAANRNVLQVRIR